LRFREKVYGNHPFARPEAGLRDTVEKLTRQDCVDFHARAFVPNNTLIAIIGDFNADELVAEIKKLTAAWKSVPVDLPRVPEVNFPKESSEEILSMPDAAQLHVFLGHVGIPRKSPDYYKLLVLDYVLGVGPGFTDRLSSHLRDREGLAYSVGADFTVSAGDQPGLFNCHIGTDPKNFARVKQLLKEELQRMVAEPPTAQEVDDAKRYLTGSLAFKLASSQNLALAMIEIERYHLGENYLQDYLDAVNAVTAADVQEVAKKYLRPDQMILVASGPIDKEGKVLKTADEK